MIADGRIIVELRSKFIIADFFFPSDDYPKGKMEIKRSKEMETKARELQSEAIRVNFTFIDDQDLKEDNHTVA